MKQLMLYSALGINNPAVISFYGAGGKTTLMQKLAAEMTLMGQKVILTTTTKMFRPLNLPEFHGCDIDQTVQSLQEHFKHSDIAVLGKQVLSDGKIEGIDPDWIGYLRDQLSISVLVEADGAKKMPVKGYADYEPVLPASSDMIISIIGADALGAAANSLSVHRLKEFLQATGTKEGSLIDEKIITGSFKQMLKIGRNQAAKARTFSVLNKADLLNKPGKVALGLAGLLSEESICPERFLVTEGTSSNTVKITLDLKPEEPGVSVSCVILAAGESTRMGRDKLSLKIGNKTILEETLNQVIRSGIKDIVVVTGSLNVYYELFKRKKIRLIENPLYKTGMASSLQAGLRVVDEKAQGVIFALADQPQVSSNIYRSLCNKYSASLPLCVYPVFKGKRGNPALFDRRTWPEFMNLTGEQGGREVLKHLEEDQIESIRTNTPSILLDIDGPDDYLFYLSYLSNSER